ncbi:hypothetical protein D3C71_1561930 [compost metagenome]
MPAGLTQADAFAGEKARQGQADGFDEVFVADDAHLAAGCAGGVIFEAGAVDLLGVAVAQSVDQAQVERSQLLLLHLDDLNQYGMGLGFVFLYRAGQGAAWQFDQALQWRAFEPADAVAGRGHGVERQVQVAGTFQYQARRATAQTQALDQGGKA